MQYHLIEFGHLNAKSAALANQAFVLWKTVFEQELKKRNLELHENDFWNAKILAVISDGSEIVGSHIYNVFDLRTFATRTHSYLSNIPETKIFELTQKKAQKMMSMEYLLVNPKYRGRSLGFSWGEVIIGLGFQVVLHSPWDAGFGIAREDRKVDQMASKVGAKGIATLTMNQTPCDIMVGLRDEIRPHENPLAQKQIEKLWSGVINSSPSIQIIHSNIQKAA